MFKHAIQIFYEFFHKIILFYASVFDVSEINELEAFADAISSPEYRFIHSLFAPSPQIDTQDNVLDLTPKHIILCIQLIDTFNNSRPAAPEPALDENIFEKLGS